MAEVEAKNLKQYLVQAQYDQSNETYKAITNAIKQYKSLRTYRDTYTFNDGTPKNLINLSGTIPVSYKGSVYNIPIIIWIMDTHPRNAPICYVKPTANMSIKVSRFVDQNGKVYLPYLHDWDSGSSDLFGLIQVMIMTFGEQPPVFAKRMSDYNPTPPYMNYPQQSQMGVQPPYPTQYGSMMPGMPMGMTPSPAMPPIAPNVAGAGYMPPYPTNTPAMSPYPPPASTIGMPMPPSSGAGGAVGMGTIKDEHIRDSLLSAIEDKLMRRMKEQLSQNEAELDTLKRTQQELQQGRTKLDAIITRLTKERDDLQRQATVLEDKEQELNKAIDRLKSQDAIDIDEAVITTAPLYKQLLNSFAEEAAIEDCIYHMGEALFEKVIDIDTFLKQVRMLSRKQFMLRALMQKCRQKAGLSAI